MKNLGRILPLALLTLLVLTACARPASNQPVSGSSAAQDKTVAVDTSAPTVPTSRYGTGMNCDVLKGAEARQSCETQVNEMIGSMLESEITSSFDIGRCKELPSVVAKSCEARLTEMGIKGPVSADEIALYNEIIRGTPNEDSASLSQTYDSARCAELKAVGYKEYCEAQIAKRTDQGKFNEILQSKDKNRCDELTTESLKNDCKRFFGIEVPSDIAPASGATVPAPATTSANLEAPAN